MTRHVRIPLRQLSQPSLLLLLLLLPLLLLVAGGLYTDSGAGSAPAYQNMAAAQEEEGDSMPPEAVQDSVQSTLECVLPPCFGNISAEANQDSVEITLGTGDDGLGMRVVHTFEQTDEPVRLSLVDAGDIYGTTILVTSWDAIDRKKQPSWALPYQIGSEPVAAISKMGARTAEYNLTGAISLADGVYTLEYAYPHTTVFALPDGASMVFVNDRIVELGDKDKIACHGCSMTLYYAKEISSRAETAEIAGYAAFLVGVASSSEVGEFSFDAPRGEISLWVDGTGRQLLDVAIPTELMGEPFTVSLDGKKIIHQKRANGTHTSIAANLESGGLVSISGAPAQHVLQYMQQQMQERQSRGAESPDDGTWTVAAAVAGLAAIAAAAVFTTRRRFSRR